MNHRFTLPQARQTWQGRSRGALGGGIRLGDGHLHVLFFCRHESGDTLAVAIHFGASPLEATEGSRAWGCPWALSVPHWMTAISHNRRKRLKKSGGEEAPEP